MKRNILHFVVVGLLFLTTLIWMAHDRALVPVHDSFSDEEPPDGVKSEFDGKELVQHYVKSETDDKGDSSNRLPVQRESTPDRDAVKNSTVPHHHEIPAQINVAPAVLGNLLEHKNLLDASLQRIVIRQEAATTKVSILLDDTLEELHLTPESFRSPSFRVSVRGGDQQSRVVVPAPTRTLRGFIAGKTGTLVAASLVHGQIRASIYGLDQREYYLEPAPEMEGVPASTYVLYERGSMMELPNFCMVDHASRDQPSLASIDASAGHDKYIEPRQASSGVGGPLPGTRVAEIALDADYDLYVKLGGSVQAVVDEWEMIMNAVNAIYERDLGVYHHITEIIVRTDPAADPYQSTSANTLLDIMQNEWNRNEKSVIRDVAHLLAGKDFSGTTVGLAIKDVLCRESSAYGISQFLPASMAQQVGVVAHEIGHNWGAGHCDGYADCFIMCSTSGGCSEDETRFGAYSKFYIGDAVNRSGCLFTDNQAQLDISAKPPVAGTVTGGGRFPVEETVSIRAFANEGWLFSSWSDQNTLAARTLDIPYRNLQLAAYFKPINPNWYEPADSIDGVTVKVWDESQLLKDGSIVTGRAFHLTHGTIEDQIVELGPSLAVDPNARLRFRSRLGGATSGQTAYVDVSRDLGETWTEFWSQVGVDHPGETTFKNVDLSLGAFSGDDIRIRFRYSYSMGAYYYSQSDFDFGWLIDEIRIGTFSQLNVVAQPFGAGTTAGGGEYFAGEEVTVTASPAPGWYFADWSDGRADNPYVFKLTADELTLYARFTTEELERASLTVVANPPVGGTVYGDGMFLVGSTQTLIASASEGYVWMGWSDGEKDTARTVIVSSLTNTYVANFEWDPVRVIGLSGELDYGVVEVGDTVARTLTITNTGNIRLTVTNILYPAGYSGTWTGQVWSGSSTNIQVEFSPTEEIAYDGVLQVLADFTAGTNQFALSGTGFVLRANLNLQASPSEGGLVEGAGRYPVGSTQILEAVASEGWQFDAWSDGVTINPRQIVVPEVDVELTALFSLVPTRIIGLHGELAFGDVLVGESASLTLAITNSGNSMLTINRILYPEGFGGLTAIQLASASATNLTITFAPLFEQAYGGTVEILADQTGGSTLIDCSGTGRLIRAEIILVASPDQGGTVTGGGYYEVGSTRLISAVANSGYRFDAWSDGYSMASRQVVVPVDGAMFTALFLSIQPETGGWDAGYTLLGVGDWRRSPWFGDYTPVNDGWLYHNVHGFWYTLPLSTPESIFFWSTDLGWLWTSSTTYSYLYRFDPPGWIWYQPDSTGPRWFLNAVTGLWEPW